MRHFVEFFDGRRFFVETETRQLIAEQSVDEALRLMPDYTYGFRFFGLVDKLDPPPFEYPGVDFQPVYKRLYESGMYFPDGVIYNQKQIGVMANQNHDRWDILYSNMTCNDWSHVVVTRSGNTTTFDPKKDQVL